MTQKVSTPAPPSVGVEGASASPGSVSEMQIPLLLSMPRGLECLGAGEEPGKVCFNTVSCSAVLALG